jgi:hypothetical protein
VVLSKCKEEIGGFLKEGIINTKGWKPAIINDEPSDYPLKFSFWY